MSDPLLVGDGARLSLIQKLRQIESLQPGMPMPVWLRDNNWGWTLAKLAGEAADALELDTRTIDAFSRALDQPIPLVLRGTLLDGTLLLEVSSEHARSKP